MKKYLSKGRYMRILLAKYRKQVEDFYFEEDAQCWVARMNDGKAFVTQYQDEIIHNIKCYVEMKEKEKTMSQENKFDFDDEIEETSEPNAEVAKTHEVIEPMEIECIKCHEKFLMVPTEIKFYRSHGYEMPKRCPKCRVDKTDTVEIECKDCGKTFTVSAREKDYFVSRGLALPKRCKQCREFRRQSQRNE